MLKYELKKLFVKQYALLAIFIIAIIETMFFNGSYTEKEFDNALTKEIYYSYIDIMQGKLNEDKEQFILDEQEKILNAKANMKILQNRLFAGDFFDKNDYRAELIEIQNELQKSAAFDMIYDQYKYSKIDRKNRYILSCGDLGFCRDNPDVIFVIFLVAFSALYFLNEESSQMIVLIRSCESSKRNTFLAKITSLIIMIITSHILISFIEYLFLCNALGNEVLCYPLQSLEYFGGCKYSITILRAFMEIQILKLLGYIFIAAVTVLLTILNKKPMLAVSLPLVICVLQQFIFQEADGGYYLPTGFLRATGYLRGDAFETVVNYAQTTVVKVFSEVPKEILLRGIIIILIVVFFTICIGLHYYKGKKSKRKYVVPAVLSTLIVVLLTGCNNNDYTSRTEDEKIYCNLKTVGVIAQNDEYYFYNEKYKQAYAVTAARKNGNEIFSIFHDAFDDEAHSDNMYIVGNDLYVFRYEGAKNFTLFKVSLDDYDCEIIAKQNEERHSVFLGLQEQNNIILDNLVFDSFTDGDNIFFVTGDGEVYQTDKLLNNVECVIVDRIYNNDNLIYTGDMIYYINNQLELIQYNVETRESIILADDFVTAFDICRDKIIFSDKNGIFSLKAESSIKEKLSDMTADSILLDGSTYPDSNKIIFQSENKLYLMKDGKIDIIFDEPILSFGIIENCDKLLCIRYNSESKSMDQFYIDISTST